MIKIDCPRCIHTGGYGIWIWVNLTSPLCPSVSHYIFVPSSLSWCTVETMATTPHLSVKVARCNISEQKADCKSSVGTESRIQERKGNLCLWLYVPFSFLNLSCFFVCIVCLFFCSYGQFWGGWTNPVSLSGRGCRYPSTTHSQLSPATSHLVQRRAQDSTQQSHVSPFLFVLVFGPAESFLGFSLYLCLILWIPFGSLVVPGGL